MRVLRRKGLAVLLAGLCLLLAGCSGQSREINDFSKVGEGLDFAPKYVQKFSNGFMFTAALPEGNQLALNYENPQTGEVLSCYIQTQPLESLLPPVTEQRQAGDVQLTYYTVVYKYVPSGYEQTEADKAAQAAGEMLLSVGSDEIEENTGASVAWQEAGVYYKLFGMDLSLTADELMDMAEEIINSGAEEQNA